MKTKYRWRYAYTNTEERLPYDKCPHCGKYTLVTRKQEITTKWLGMPTGKYKYITVCIQCYYKK